MSHTFGGLLVSRLIRTVLVAGLVAGMGACSPPGNQACPPGMGDPTLLFSLFFGRSIQGRGEVTDADWLGFLVDTVTPNLPNGYTVSDAVGAWMNPQTHTTTYEPTKEITVALPESPDSLAAVNRVRSVYQARFHQQLVGMAVNHACGSF